MNVKKSLKYGDRMGIRRELNLSDYDFLKIVNDPDADPDKYKLMIDYLKNRDKMEQFFKSNEHLFKGVYSYCSNVKSIIDRNKDLSGYNVKNIMENMADLKKIINTIENEHNRTFTEK